MTEIVALDFETADQAPDSACAVGLVRISRGRIVAEAYRLIRPPRRAFRFTHIHGIRWADVEDAPSFGECWPELSVFMRGAEALAAHYAPFDRRVLAACCAAYGIAAPDTPFLCTVRLARRVWDIWPTKLPDVCRRLRIPLSHHHARSDALACARIVEAALARGAPLEDALITG